MPCGGSSQVFAFTTLSPSSKLSLASCMTTSSLLDFATASPAFMVFLRTHCEEIVLAALRTQYGYIPDISSWNCCNLLPLYNNLPHIPNTHELSHNQTKTPAERQHKRGTRDTTELLQELPILQWLVDEEQLSENGRKLLDILPQSEHSLGLYYAGVRGLVRYCQKYTALCSSLVAKRDIHEQMQRWLQERYTPWGINEMWFVVDALYSRIDEILPSLQDDQTRREQLLGALLCKMDILRVCGGYNTFSIPPSATAEEKTLQLLLDNGIIELPSTPTRVPLSELQWRVRDGSHSHWFTTPTQNVLSGRSTSSHSLYWSSEPSSAANYVISHGNHTGVGLEQGDIDQASLDLARTPRNWHDIKNMKLMVMGVAARASRATRTKTIGLRRGMWTGRKGFVDWGMIGT